jgi:putative sigma-54 modulation protein
VARVNIEISTRHGSLESDSQAYLQEKAEKLLKYFGRLMSIEVEVEHRKHSWQVEIFVSAEHKHDFVAREEAPTPEMAMDQCVHKVEQQLRRYKERVQQHRDAVPHGGTSPTRPDLPEPPGVT